MNKKLIAFTIENPTSGDYQKIKNKIKSTTRAWAQIDETLYVVITERSSVNMREIINDVSLKGKLNKIFVTEWNHPSAWYGLDEDISNWLLNN